MTPSRTLLGLAAVALTTLGATAPATAHGDHPTGRDDFTFAVIGDVPYGDAQVAAFPGWLQQVNSDPDVRTLVHVGDIKNGSTVCSDEYFDLIRHDFDTVEDPLVFTPGDNEWTDCHRANNGSYNPLERLAKVREVFFGRADRTLGQHSMHVESQARQGFPENVLYRQADVTFVAANVTGSNNGLQPWSGLGYTAPTPEQRQAVAERTRADIRLLHDAFLGARKHRD